MRVEVIAIILFVACARAAYVRQYFDNDQCTGNYLGFFSYPTQQAPPCQVTTCTPLGKTNIYVIDDCSAPFVNNLPFLAVYNAYGDSNCTTIGAQIGSYPDNCMAFSYDVESGLALYLRIGSCVDDTLNIASFNTSDCTGEPQETYTSGTTCEVLADTGSYSKVEACTTSTPVAPPTTQPVAAPVAPVAPVAAPVATPVAAPVKKSSSETLVGITSVGAAMVLALL